MANLRKHGDFVGLMIAYSLNDEDIKAINWAG
jgi:hypothetical protein